MTPPRHPVDLRALFGPVVDHGDLLWQFSRRELSGRYRGSLIGLGWALINPLLLLAVYTYVFSVVFRIRWDQAVPDRTGFALAVYAGMLVHGFFAECMTRAPTLIVENRNLVKRVVFPLQILPWSALVVAGFHLLLGVALIAAVVLVRDGAVPLTVVALPAILAPLALLALGVAYAFSSLGVYVRDLSQVVGFVALTLLFVSPVFYPPSAVPENWRFVLAVNPLAATMEMMRGAMLASAWPPLPTLAAVWACGMAAAWAGFYWFQRTRKGFADVL